MADAALAPAVAIPSANAINANANYTNNNNANASNTNANHHASVNVPSTALPPPLPLNGHATAPTNAAVGLDSDAVLAAPHLPPASGPNTMALGEPATEAALANR